MKKRTTTATDVELARWRALDKWNVRFAAHNVEANPARCNTESAAHVTSEDLRFLRALGIEASS